MPADSVPLSREELRRQAHELRRAVSDGREAAIERVLALHPKYSGRPASRLRPERFSLSDAQATIALEHGFSSWKDLCAAVEPEDTSRWQESRGHALWARAYEEAKRRDHDWVGAGHIVLALLTPADRTIASRVLTELGLSYSDAADRLPRRYLRVHEGITTNPRFLMCRALAEGLALARGEQFADEHALLALAYHDDGELFTEYNLDPDDIYETLARNGVLVPPMRPPIAPTPSGPMGARVYFPRTDLSAVLVAVEQLHPPGTSYWGFNHSRWRPDDCWIDSEDEVDAAGIVRGVVADVGLVEVVPIEIASEREAEAAAIR